ncbi:MAG: ABC transporter ATP-binding protein [Anaerolineaceae bacterium]|nr:ABC transporter ATP-binding protein [Anaerolineaceae bacterium]
MESILQISDLTKVYGFRGNHYPALNGLSLGVGKGEFLGVMGPSGSGKTTLLNIIATIDRGSRGVVMINGQDTQRMRRGDLTRFRREHLGFIFQDYNLLDTLTLRENICLPLSIANQTPAEIKARLSSVTQTFGLHDVLDKFPAQVSGGQKQRAAAARAIISNPTMVLADEPTGALDSSSAKVLLQTLEKMNQSLGITILMVTHDATAASYCNRIVFLKDGRIISELRRAAQQPRRAFFDQILSVVALMGEKEAE